MRKFLKSLNQNRLIMIELAVTLGIVFSLFFIEVFGMAAGGIVIPGYIALQLNHPDRLIGTLIISLLTFFIIKLIARYTFLFGRRQMVVAVMIGTILSIVSHTVDFRLFL